MSPPPLSHAPPPTTSDRYVYSQQPGYGETGKRVAFGMVFDIGRYERED